MKFGISLQNRGPASSPENLALVVSRAEELGFDSAFVGDHIVIPDSFIVGIPIQRLWGFHRRRVRGMA